MAHGNVGIGITNPSEQFEIFKSTTSPGVLSLRSARNDAQHVEVARISAKQNTTEVARIGMPRAGHTNSGYLTFWTKYSNSSSLVESMRINASGNVIVYNTLEAKEIKVVAHPGADFVFQPNYKLRPLTELESFIQENQHLPEIAPAKQMEEEGVLQSEMNQKLLQKIEELTLYMIELNKEVKGLKKENKQQKEEIKMLKLK